MLSNYKKNIFGRTIFLINCNNHYFCIKKIQLLLPCTKSRCAIGWGGRASLESIWTSNFIWKIRLLYLLIFPYNKNILYSNMQKIYVAVIIHILSVKWPLGTLKIAIKSHLLLLLSISATDDNHTITVLSKYYENVFISLSGLYILKCTKYM